MSVLVGGVAQLFQGDLDFGRRAVEQLALEQLPAGVVVEELSYGAVAVAQRLEELRPDALVLVGAERRGRAPATLERRPPPDVALSTDELRMAVADAVTGYVGIDLLFEVTAGLGALPRDAVAIELEPVRVAPSDVLSPEAEAALPKALGLVRGELSRLLGESS